MTNQVKTIIGIGIACACTAGAYWLKKRTSKQLERIAKKEYVVDTIEELEDLIFGTEMNQEKEVIDITHLQES